MKTSYYHFKIIDSTNTWAKQNVDLFDRTALTVIVAEGQTAGRGRFNRSWVSPDKQNVYVTYCLFVDKKRVDVGNIPQLLALCAVHVLETLHFKPKLKWPNDILINQKKIGGILCETVDCSDSLCVVVGIGININMPLDLLQKIDRPATSLFVESGTFFEVEKVIELLTLCFTQSIDLFLKNSFSPFILAFKRSMDLQSGQPVRFSDFLRIWEGFFHSINEDGSLNLLMQTGEIKKFISGEIINPTCPLNHA